MTPSLVDNVVTIVQARLGSTRLPGKVFATIGDRCVLKWVIDRLAGCTRTDITVVATSTQRGDDPIAERCRQWDLPVFRGSEKDVLGRFVACARAFEADLVVRVNADNPLVDPAYVDELVVAHESATCHYHSYCLRDGRPVMLSGISFFTETISRSCLERANGIVQDPFEREHVTLGIYRRPGEFKVAFREVPRPCSDPRLRFTLDTAKDLAVLRRVWGLLGNRAEIAGALTVVKLVLTSPDILRSMKELTATTSKPAR